MLDRHRSAFQPWADKGYIEAELVRMRERDESRAAAYPLFWRVRLIRPEWFGRRCRIVVHGGKRGARLVEFDNGERVICSGAYLRRAA